MGFPIEKFRKCKKYPVLLGFENFSKSRGILTRVISRMKLLQKDVKDKFYAFILTVKVTLNCEKRKNPFLFT